MVGIYPLNLYPTFLLSRNALIFLVKNDISVQEMVTCGGGGRNVGVVEGMVVGTPHLDLYPQICIAKKPFDFSCKE